MQSRLRVQGHPIQPMLVTFPYGLFVCAVIFDLADVVGGPVFLGEVGYWTAVAALVAAALTAIAGMVDLWDVPPDRTRRTAISFNVVNAGMAGLFLLSCLIRADATNRGAGPALLVVELLALGVGGVGVHLGARLMRHFEGSRPEAASVEIVRGLDAPTVEVVRPRP
ncbi:DUF2231 domain-containing protein [Micromonospora andamanensis]|uniref:DUF2231 domain-containing protein n=1 Tax=Micromonospora andamanensis TaxID=1287068 RepID=A0ABQ4I526_9ACTN|nr:DUF2231 domain-containing protein [Micromonospora andamanensis]GIJ12985.1 hypothetical protein Van01_61990 [Micromonospora andamanensis]